MIIYIPQNIDKYNTHLKNLAEAYTSKGVTVLTGYNTFISDDTFPDVIHFHQFEGLLSQLKFDENLFFTRLDLYKKEGVYLLYTAHNLLPHKKIKKVDHHSFLTRFLNYMDIIIHHGKLSVDLLTKEFPGITGKKHIICHHGDYLSDMKCYHESKASARKILNLPDNGRLILVFGQLQFKNPSFARKASKLTRRKYYNAVLVMAGVLPVFRFNRLNGIYYKFNNLLLNKLRKHNVYFLKRFSQYETYLLFTAADLVFLPHNSGLTTGIIPMAATLGKPFVYPDIGVFEEQANFCAAGKYECGHEISAFNAIDKILSSGLDSFDNSLWLKENNWGQHVENILFNLKDISRDFGPEKQRKLING